MNKNHKQIPLLAKLGIYYTCDRCKFRTHLGTFYKGMEEIVIAASSQDGKLICWMCRKAIKDLKR